jgi:hypothetical protein
VLRGRGGNVGCNTTEVSKQKSGGRGRGLKDLRQAQAQEGKRMLVADFIEFFDQLTNEFARAMTRRVRVDVRHVAYPFPTETVQYKSVKRRTKEEAG